MCNGLAKNIICHGSNTAWIESLSGKKQETIVESFAWIPLRLIRHENIDISKI